MKPPGMEQNTLTRQSIIMALTEEGGVGPKMFQHLLMHLGPPEELHIATASDFQELPRINAERAARILSSLDRADEYMGKIIDYAADDIFISSILDDDYPKLLRVIDDPPPLIYYRGDCDILDRDFIAMAGTTKATQSGLRLTVDLSRALIKRGYGIISGLASGIDSAAHLGALKEKGATIAVLGSGIMEIYPEENVALAELIGKSGLLLSEHPPFKMVSKSSLVLRNRIISAMSRAVIVVQLSAETRGELHTAAYACRQAKPLYYGDPDDNFDFERVKDWPGSIVRSVDAVDEILSYIVPERDYVDS